MWKRELIRNKIYAVLMVLVSLPVVILEKFNPFFITACCMTRGLTY